MYRIEPLPPLPATPKPLHTDAETCPVDRDRDLTVWRLGSVHSPGLVTWLFEHQGALVPFETTETLVGDGPHPITTELTLGSFGLSHHVLLRTGILDYEFSSGEQAREWALLAIEGVLVYYANRFKNFDRSARLIAFERTWTVDDFGYNKGDFRDDV